MCYIIILYKGKGMKIVTAFWTAENHCLECGTRQCVRYRCHVPAWKRYLLPPSSG